MAWNRFEEDRGPVACGACARPLGHRIDREPGVAVIICGACYAKRTGTEKPGRKPAGGGAVDG